MRNKKDCMGVRVVDLSNPDIPCGGRYYQSDCVFFSNGVLDGSMDLGANPNLSEFAVCLLTEISSMRKYISKLEDRIINLENKI